MIFQPSNLLMAGVVAAVAMAAQPSSASANCGHDWAKPGTYTISGNFRGKNETAGAEVTRDCRIQIKVPGVYTGGPIRSDGKCVTFTFKVDNEPGMFKGRWCDNTATVNWKGKRVEASIRRVGFR